ncbi:Magnesium-dependent phosphatase 1, partial [Mucuna pruriens]
MEDVERVKAEALQIMGVFQVLPKLVVFDLDYTLWPFYWYLLLSMFIYNNIMDLFIACLVKLFDDFSECRSKHDTPTLFPHSRGILHALKHHSIDVAIASKSPTPHIATTFLDKLRISSMFVAQEIFYTWTHKTDHFQRIHSRTGVPYNSMLFFDDDNNNIQEWQSQISKIGVTSILVRNGVNLGEFRNGLEKFSQNRNASKNRQKRPKTTLIDDFKYVASITYYSQFRRGK